MEREVQFLFSVFRRIAFALVCLCKVENIDKYLSGRKKMKERKTEK